MVNSSELKKGMLLDIDGAPWQILDCAFQTPSARGASTITKVKLKNLKTGQTLSRSYRGEMLQEADCEKRPVQFLYKDGEEFVFMDEQSYEQFNLGADVLGEQTGFFLDGLQCRSLLYNDEVYAIELPLTVDLVVTETAPTIKGATAQAQLKSAITETGLEVMVPPYLSTGEKIRVDTRDGRFVGRAND